MSEFDSQYQTDQTKGGDKPALSLKEEIRKEFDETLASVKDFGER